MSAVALIAEAIVVLMDREQEMGHLYALRAESERLRATGFPLSADDRDAQFSEEIEVLAVAVDAAIKAKEPAT